MVYGYINNIGSIVYILVNSKKSFFLWKRNYILKCNFGEFFLSGQYK